MSGSIKKVTPNYALFVPKFDSPNWAQSLERNFEIIDAGIFAASGLGNIVGVWENGVTYQEGDRVYDGENYSLWQAVTTHVSATSGDFAEDRAARPELWQAISSKNVYRGLWQSGIQYLPNEFVSTPNHQYGVVVEKYVSGTSYNSDVANNKIITLIDLSQTYADAIDAKDKSKVSETNAKASENAAKAAQTNSANSATASANSATASATSATNSKASENAAKASETNTKNSENAAKLSETNAANSASTASTQATLATNKAEAAKTSETNAKSSETKAANSASAAATSASNSSAAATASSEFADEAKGYSESSATSASASASSATAAAGSATNASQSKDAAATSATNSASSATAANTSATNAAASATKAENKAGEAEASASTANAAATNSASHALLSSKWATNPEDEVVADGKYSAYHWAQKASEIVNQGGGTVTSVGITPPTGMTASEDITVSGKIVLDYAAGYLPFTQAMKNAYDSKVDEAFVNNTVKNFVTAIEVNQTLTDYVKVHTLDSELSRRLFKAVAPYPHRLNDLVTSGVYYENSSAFATESRDFPFDGFAHCVILVYASDHTVYQELIYTELEGVPKFTRIRDTFGDWTPWEAAATMTDVDRKMDNRRITISTADPSGGVNNDIWFKVT